MRTGIGGPIEAMAAPLLALDAPIEQKLKAAFAFLRTEVLGTRRKDIIRLFITEAGRFPEIAEFYHREVLARGLGLLRALAEGAVARGEFRSDALVRFPQLVVAPVLVALVWAHLFERFEPLDSAAMFDAHVDLLMRAMRGEAP